MRMINNVKYVKRYSKLQKLRIIYIAVHYVEKIKTNNYERQYQNNSNNIE